MTKQKPLEKRIPTQASKPSRNTRYTQLQKEQILTDYCASMIQTMGPYYTARFYGA